MNSKPALEYTTVSKKMPEKIWIAREEPDPELVGQLILELNAPEVMAKLLVQRGVDTPDKVKEFYNPNLANLHDPFLMKDMDKAVERIQKAIETNEGVLIFGDYDVDGTTSVALAYSFFRTQIKKIDYYIPDRYKEGYGISKEGIDFAKRSGLSLIIALDCGIRSVDLVEYASSIGIDFIICDHHLPGDEMPQAVAVLDPKRSDCEYPYKELAGCGIGFKLVEAFAQVNDIPDQEYLPLLDLVVLSIASDIVPITGENRILAYYGLKVINQKPRLGVKALIEVSINKEVLGIGDLVFYLGPRINAAGRMDDAKSAVKLLISDTAHEAMDFAEELQKQNVSRRAVDEKITADLKEIVVRNPKLLDQKSFVFYQEDWHKGVIGIAASRAIELYYRPTIVLTKSGDYLSGSARSIAGFDVHDALEKCSEHLIQFGGHKYAAGMTLDPAKLDAFRSAFEHVAQQSLNEDDLTPKVQYNAEIDVEEIDDLLLNMINRMAPFGPENLTPVFKSSQLVDDGTGKIIGKTKEHLRLNIARNRNSLPAVGFGMADKLDGIKKASSFEACFQINENVFRGNRSIQLMLKDVKTTNGI